MCVSPWLLLPLLAGCDTPAACRCASKLLT